MDYMEGVKRTLFLWTLFFHLSFECGKRRCEHVIRLQKNDCVMHSHWNNTPKRTIISSNAIVLAAASAIAAMLTNDAYKETPHEYAIFYFYFDALEPQWGWCHLVCERKSKRIENIKLKGSHFSQTAFIK